MKIQKALEVREWTVKIHTISLDRLGLITDSQTVRATSRKDAKQYVANLFGVDIARLTATVAKRIYEECTVCGNPIKRVGADGICYDCVSVVANPNALDTEWFTFSSENDLTISDDDDITDETMGGGFDPSDDDDDNDPAIDPPILNHDGLCAKHSSYAEDCAGCNFVHSGNIFIALAKQGLPTDASKDNLSYDDSTQEIVINEYPIDPLATSLLQTALHPTIPPYLDVTANRYGRGIQFGTRNLDEHFCSIHDKWHLAVCPDCAIKPPVYNNAGYSVDYPVYSQKEPSYGTETCKHCGHSHDGNDKIRRANGLPVCSRHGTYKVDDCTECEENGVHPF